ncbi:hypothetical protein ABZS76_19160 [Streptomyces sp. NPDC005562]|uniref:hypothetical protein n=2 Tax=unclassified Streptomyces TaxID=2593676 RepID=UPI0033A7DD5E
MPLNKKKADAAGADSRKAGIVVFTVAGCLVAAGAVAVAGPALKNSALMPDAVSEHVFKEKTKSFATASAAPTKGDLAFVLPAWIPDDARNVKVKVKTTGGAKLIRYTLVGRDRDGRTGRGADCGADAPRVGGPDLDASWWPDRTPSRSRTDCGDLHTYRVAVDGDTVYAWTNGEVSPGAGEAEAKGGGAGGGAPGGTGGGAPGGAGGS